jgi:Sigma-54 interaction domain
MNATTGPDLSLLDPYRAEWRSLLANRHNLLVEGPLTVTHAALLLLKPHIGAPIEWKRPRGRFELPSREGGALILEDVGTLTADDQTELLARLDRARSHPHIISTTEHSLFALVARGLFDPALYYRLNVVLLRFNQRDRHATQSGRPYRSASISTPPPL